MVAGTTAPLGSETRPARSVATTSLRMWSWMVELNPVVSVPNPNVLGIGVLAFQELGGPARTRAVPLAGRIAFGGLVRPMRLTRGVGPDGLGRGRLEPFPQLFVGLPGRLL